MISGASEQELANARANIVMKLDNTSTYESWLIIDTYLEQLEKEKQELKKQLEDMTLCRDIASGHREEVQDRENILLTQKKEFINYLEDKIYSIEPKGTGINYNCEYDSEEDYVMAMQEQSRLNTLKETLQSYKETIGAEDDTNRL